MPSQVPKIWCYVSLHTLFLPHTPPPLQSPPGGGGTSLFCWAISVAVVCVPHLSHTRSCIALPFLQISHLCVFCDILSPKAVYRVLCPFFRPKMFSPGDRVWYHSRTLGAHVLATVVGPSPNGPQFCHIECIRPGGVTQVNHEGAQLSRLRAVVVASPKSLCLCSVFASLECTTICLEMPLQSPPPPDTVALWREISRGRRVVLMELKANEAKASSSLVLSL